MIDKEAFMAGAAQYCETAGITGEDRDAFVHLVANGDDKTIALVKAAKKEEDAKKKDDKDSNDKPKKKDTALKPIDAKRKMEGEKLPVEKAVADETAPKKPTMLSRRDSRDALKNILGTSSGPGEGLLGSGALQELIATLPRVSKAQKRHLIGRMAMLGEAPREQASNWNVWGGPKSTVRADDDSPWSIYGSETAQDPADTAVMSRARQAAMRHAGDIGDWQNYETIAREALVATGGVTPAQAAEQAAKQTSNARVRLGKRRKQEAATAAATKAQLPQEVAIEPAVPGAAPAVAGAPAAAPTEYTPPALSEPDKAAGVAAAERLSKLTPGQLQGMEPALRQEWLPKLQQAVLATAGDDEMMAKLLPMVRSVGLTTEERQAFDPMMKQLNHQAAQYGHRTNDWRMLEGLSTDVEMSKATGQLGPESEWPREIRELEAARRSGNDDAFKELQNTAKANAAIDPSIGDFLDDYMELHNTSVKASRGVQQRAALLGPTGDTAVDKTDKADGTPQTFESFKKVWDAGGPGIKRLTDQGLSAEQQWSNQRARTVRDANRVELERWQLSRRSNKPWSTIAAMTDEEIRAKAGGNQGEIGVLERGRQLAGLMIGQPVGAGMPSAEAKLRANPNTPPEQLVSAEEKVEAEQAKRKRTWGEIARARIPALKAQNKEWTTGLDGNIVQRGRWGETPQEQAIAEKPEAPVPAEEAIAAAPEPVTPAPAPQPAETAATATPAPTVSAGFTASSMPTGAVSSGSAPNPQPVPTKPQDWADISAGRKPEPMFKRIPDPTPTPAQETAANRTRMGFKPARTGDVPQYAAEDAADERRKELATKKPVGVAG